MIKKKITLNNKDYEIKCINYKDISKFIHLQKHITGQSYYKKFRLDKHKSYGRFNVILREVLREADRDMLFGATIDYGCIKMRMGKILTDRKSPTILNNKLHIPIVKMKSFKRLKHSSYSVIPTLRLQHEIARMMKTNIYDNIIS